MSYTTIYKVTPGQSAEELHEFRNGHGAAPVVWSALCKEVGLEEHGWLFNSQKVWDIWKIPGTPEWKRVTLGLTFDGVYLEYQHFPQASKAIREFFRNYPQDPNRVNHWLALADLIEGWIAEDTIPAIGIRHTSCGESIFDGSYDEASGTYTIDWEKAWSLYPALQEETAA